MKTIINKVELLDANGRNFDECIKNYVKGNQSQFTRHTHNLIKGLPRYDIPLTDEELDIELE